MVKAIREKPEERCPKCRTRSRRETTRRRPHTQPDAEREEPAREEELHIPSPRRAIRRNRQPIQRVAHHAQPLPNERRAAGVVAVPQRELAALEDGLVRQHRVGPMADLHYHDIGAFELLRLRGGDAGNGRRLAINPMAARARGKETFSEKDDRETGKHHRQRRDDSERLNGTRSEPSPERENPLPRSAQRPFPNIADGTQEQRQGSRDRQQSADRGCAARLKRHPFSQGENAPWSGRFRASFGPSRCERLRREILLKLPRFRRRFPQHIAVLRDHPRTPERDLRRAIDDDEPELRKGASRQAVPECLRTGDHSAIGGRAIAHLRAVGATQKAKSLVRRPHGDFHPDPIFARRKRTPAEEHREQYSNEHARREEAF